MTGEAMTGEAMTGEAMTGEAMTGEAMTGEAMTGEAMTGEAMTGEAMTGEAMTENGPNPQTASSEAGSTREISDPRTMRAFAHPVRIALIEALRRDGPLTATRAAELLDDSPGNMSWHLQTLAKYGFVEDAGGGRGRSRPWRLVSLSHSFETAFNDPESAAAEEALEANVQERNYQRLREWWSRRRSYPVKWRRAAFSSNALAYLTAEETQQLSEELIELLSRYRGRTLDRTERPPGALPVSIVAFAHPLPPTPSGN